MEVNVRVLVILNSSSHSSLVVNGLELKCLAAILCMYETMVTKVVRSCAVDAKIKDLSHFQWKSAHAPKKELPQDFL